MIWPTIAANAVAVGVLMTVLWIVSVFRKDVSIVDPWWSMLFLLMMARTVATTEITPGKIVLLVLVTVWAIRLWLHLLIRRHGKPEDPRYRAFRQRFGPDRYWWMSFFQVFMLQGLLALIISAPLQWEAMVTAPDPIRWNHIVGCAVFTVGFLFEAVADWQLQRFRNDPSSRGRVMDRGLWDYSRHPNYFGEATLWWGFWLCVLSQPYGWATFFGPALITIMLLRVSGVTLLDSHLRATRPGYADYIARTPAFLPGRRRSRPSS